MRGSITKKKGRLYIIYYVGKKPKWEKVPENKRGVQTKAEAERLLAQRIAEVNSETYQEIKKATFQEFSERWLRDYVDDPNHIKSSTAQDYHRMFKVFLLPQFGDHWLTNVSADEVQKLVGALGKRGLAPWTIRAILTPLTTMLKHAVQWGYLKSSPMGDVVRPPIKKKEMAFLPPDEIRLFLGHVPKKWYSFFITAALSGMRMSELVAMKWGNLDMDGQQYHVKERYYMGAFDSPKSRQSRRSVDLTSSVVMALRGHRAAQNERKLAAGAEYEDQNLIFAWDNGKPNTQPNLLREALQNALEAAGLPQIRFHGLRHSYATLLIDQGATPKYIQHQLGHASIKQTFDTYGHLMPDAGAALAEALDRRVFGTAP